MKWPSWLRGPRAPAAPDSRQRILTALRSAVQSVPFQPSSAMVHQPVIADAPDYVLPQEMIERFGAELTRVSGTWESADSVAAARLALLIRLREMKATQVLLWSPDTLGIPYLRDRLEDEGIRCLGPNEILSAQQEAEWSLRVVRLEEISQIDLGISGADAAIAATGTLVVRSGKGRNRLPSLLPEHHIALVPWSRVYPTLEFWLTELRQAGLAQSMWQEVSNVTFITGPSRSGDIESNLVLGAHGPKEVHVILFNTRA